MLLCFYHIVPVSGRGQRPFLLLPNRDVSILKRDFSVLNRDFTETDTAASADAAVSVSQRSRIREPMQP